MALTFHLAGNHSGTDADGDLERDCGVPGVSFVVLLATLGSVGIPWKVWRLLPVLTVSSTWRVLPERGG